MKIVILFTLTAVFSLIFSPVPYAADSDEALEPILFNLNYLKFWPKQISSGITIEAQGKSINRNIRSFSLERLSYYEDPLSCCVAALTAAFDLDEEWYGLVAAPVEERDESGNPRKTYIADNAANLYAFYTYHTVNPTFIGVPLDFEILDYLRLGNMHGFRVRMTRERPTGQIELHAFKAVQEFMPGKFRWAYEWISPEAEVFVSVMGQTTLESTEQRTYREAFPERHYEVTLERLFGDEDNEFPVRLFFRGGKAEDQVEYQLVTNTMQRLEEVARDYALIKTQEEFDNSEIEKELALLLDHDSFELAKNIQYRFRYSVPKRFFFIDGGKIITVLSADEGQMDAYTTVQVFAKENMNYKLVTYKLYDSYQDFFLDKRVYEPLTGKIGPIMMNQ